MFCRKFWIAPVTHLTSQSVNENMADPLPVPNLPNSPVLATRYLSILPVALVSRVISVLMKMLLLQVFCGKIPKEVFEDELIPLFEKCGKIWDLRLMMDPMTGQNRGYAFITFTDRESAQEAVRQVRTKYFLCGKNVVHL